jgi:DNA-binding transcriptional MerR regulator
MDDAAPLQVGDLARAAGVTVRTLHHYDAIGLLVPRDRSSSGRRRYSAADVRRLYRIVALRRLGLPLPEIGALLDGEPDLEAAIRRHLAQVELDLELGRRLRAALTRMLDRLVAGGEPTVDEVIHAIEVMSMSEQYYTPEQLEQLEARRRKLGEAGMASAQEAWAQLIAEVRAQRERGTDPGDPRMLELAARWRALVEQFTGGDEGIRRSLATMYREEGPRAESRGMVDPELMSYVGQSLATLEE